MPESRVSALLLVTGAVVMGLLISRLRRADRRLKASQKEVLLTTDRTPYSVLIRFLFILIRCGQVQRLKDELRASMQSSRQMKVSVHQ
jgi:hypothetical protein